MFSSSHVPSSPVTDDLAEWRRHGEIGNVLNRSLLSKRLEEHGCEIAHVALLGGAAFLPSGASRMQSLRSLTTSLTAKILRGSMCS
jgi:hypothetical protein